MNLWVLWYPVLPRTRRAIWGEGTALISHPQLAQQETDIAEKEPSQKYCHLQLLLFFLHSRWWVEYCGWEFSCSTKAIVLWLNPYLLRRLWPIRKALCFTFECWGGQKACSHNFVFIRSIYHTVVTLTFVLKFPHGIFKRHKVKALSYCNFFYWSENHRT